jgi:hypothetical protein
LLETGKKTEAGKIWSGSIEMDEDSDELSGWGSEDLKNDPKKVRSDDQANDDAIRDESISETKYREDQNAVETLPHHSALPDYQWGMRDQGAECLVGLRDDFSFSNSILVSKKEDSTISAPEPIGKLGNRPARSTNTFDARRFIMALRSRWIRGPEIGVSRWVPAGFDAYTWLKLDPLQSRISGDQVGSVGPGGAW